MKKVLCIVLIILLLSSLFIVYLEGNSNASYSDKFSNYPGYKELLEDLQKEHPNWEFEILETGLDWSDVLKAQTVARHGRSLISKYDKAFDKCSVCGNKEYEPGWYCASTAAVAYYLDPRNSLCEDYIFQFEQLTYDSDIQTRNGVEKIFSDCKYLQGNITYYDTNGKKQTINKTYVDVIMEAAKQYNISPYHLASRIRQEQSSDSSIISGVWTGKDDEGNSYKGYYNYFNWGAYGSNIVLSALKTAKKNGWTDPEKSIKGGAEKIAKEYISVGQDTLYLQKFAVANGGNYGHQYMTNVSASKSEGLTTKSAYLKMGMISKESKIKFKIPAYKNMPTSKAALPGKETIVTQDVQLVRETNIRKEKSTNSDIIATLNKDTKMLRIELASSKDSSGIYWDKVILSDGKVGYVTRANIEVISTQSNCSEKYVVLNTIPLRNGPGTEGTNVIKYVSAGQMVTAVEKGKYPNLNNESWYRVKLTDGDYGYVTIGTAENPNMVLYDETSTEYDYVKVICTDGLNIRSTPTTKANNISVTVVQGTELFRLQKNASNNEGYIWDRVVTSSGIVGYAVRQDKATNEAWLETMKDTEITISGEGFKTNKDNVICQPNITVAEIKKSAKEVVIKKGDTVIKDNEKLGTGYTITVDGKTFTAVVKGDTNGDGAVKATDYMRIKNLIMGESELTDAQKLAADVNNDGKIKATDYMKIKNYIMGSSNIEI